MTGQAWWSQAVFCSEGGNRKQAMEQMEALARMGCDAAEVSPGDGYAAAAEMDELMDAAGRNKMRVVVDLDGGEQDVRARIGFWEARGVAGFAVHGLGDQAVRRLRLAARDRVVIADGDAAQLQTRKIPDQNPLGLRRWLATTIRAGVMLEDGSTRLTYPRAAMLLVSGVAARVSMNATMPVTSRAEGANILSPEELLLWVPKQSPIKDGLAKWIRDLSGLHRQIAVSGTGKAVFLDLDDPKVVTWTIAGWDGRPRFVVACNTGDKATRFSLKDALRGAEKVGTSLETLLRSDGAPATPDSLDGIGLGVDGVFVGELR